MIRARIAVAPEFRVAAVPARLFGSFVEHLGRCVYTGIYEPGHPTATEEGFRQDVLALTAELGVTIVRYPGGNFVSNFRWEDSVGPVASRPTRLDLAWHSVESNEFGLDEFVRWTSLARVEPMMALNLGTRGVGAALDLVEYCNHPGGTHWSALRDAPHYGIKTWCLGNEMDGPWQVGHKTADEYGRLAAETARAMRLVDPSLELVACGSSGSGMPTFGAWEATVLEHAYDEVDLISCHAYYEEKDGDLASFLASAVDMDAFVDSVVATADHVRARLRKDKRMYLSFDEWNVWYQSAQPPSPSGWPAAPALLEDEYNVADAVVVGGLLISLLRHCDRVTTACLAQLVNVIAPIRTLPGGPAWRQTIFHPFALTARHACGTVLRTAVDSPTTDTTLYGDVPVVDAVVTQDGAGLAVFAVNRHPSEPVSLELSLRGFEGHRVIEHLVIADDDIRATNTAGSPNRVTPRAVLTTGSTVTLPAVSWSVIRLETAG